MEKYVFKYTSAWWGESFVSELVKISDHADKKKKRLSLAETARAVTELQEDVMDVKVDDEANGEA